jgi:hypothetical protein
VSSESTSGIRRALDAVWKELAIDPRSMTVSDRDRVVSRVLARIESWAMETRGTASVPRPSLVPNRTC